VNSSVKDLSTVHARPKWTYAAGFSLLEVIISMGILTFGLMALAVMQLEALSQGASGKHSVDAAAVGRTYLEQAHRVPWAVLDTAVAIGDWTDPSWLGATASVDVNVDMPGGGTATEHSYTIQWEVTDVGSGLCLREVEVRVSWMEPKLTLPKTLDFATRRYNYGDPSC